MAPPVGNKTSDEVLYCIQEVVDRKIIARGDYNKDGLEDFVVVETQTTTNYPYSDGFEVEHPNSICTSSYTLQDKRPIKFFPDPSYMHRDARVVFGRGGFIDGHGVLHPYYHLSDRRKESQIHCTDAGEISGIKVGSLIRKSGTDMIGVVTKICTIPLGIDDSTPDELPAIVSHVTNPGKNDRGWHVEVRDSKGSRVVGFEDIAPSMDPDL